MSDVTITASDLAYRFGALLGRAEADGKITGEESLEAAHMFLDGARCVLLEALIAGEASQIPPVPEPAYGPPTKSQLAYARAALDSEAAIVAGCPEGSRNDTLNRAAYNLGRLVGGGYLDINEVYGRLYDAAVACGLPDKEIRATIASGLQDGMDEPRVLPA